MEAKLQTEIIRWLKKNGAYVLKTRPMPGIPVGCPDIIFMFEGAWGAIECKRSSNAPFRPGQQATIAHLSKWSPFVYIAWPARWPFIKAELEARFF